MTVNKYCRDNGIHFILADTYGLFGWVFVDFGNEFVVFDKNGESEKQMFVSNISQATQAEVTLQEDDHGALGFLNYFKKLN